ncbi:MAG TPA: autotransporter-associated beta strand repeat-containing protein, partial [Chthoniobacteraceae bacterium]
MGAITINTIAFNSAAAAPYTLGSVADTLTFNGGGAVTVAPTVTASQVIGSNVVLGEADGVQAFSFTNNAAPPTLLSFTGPISSGTLDTKTVTVGGSGNTVISGAISNPTGSVALVKAGSGALTLSGLNAHSGGTTLNAGVLNLNGVGALGAGLFTINGGTIDNTSAAALTLNTNPVQAWNSNFTFAGTRNLNLGTGAVTLGGTGPRQITVNANTLTVGGAVTGTSGFIKAGGGTLTLQTTASSWTGNAVVNAGTLTIQAAQATSVGYILNNGGALTSNQAMAGTNVIYANTGSSSYTNTAPGGNAGSNASVLGGNANVLFTLGNTTAINNAVFANVGGVATYGNNNSFRFQADSISPFATIDFAATSGNLYTRDFRNMVFGALQGTSNQIGINSNSVSGGSNYIIGSKNIDTTWSGRFGGTGTLNALSFVKVGTGTMTVNPNAVWSGTGAYSFNGGTLKVDYSNLATGILNATSGVNFGGGTLSLLGKNTGATTQTLGNLTVNTGGSTLLVNPNGGASTNLTLGSMTANAAGGALSIQPSNATLGGGSAVITTTSDKLADGTYGGRIT